MALQPFLMCGQVRLTKIATRMPNYGLTHGLLKGWVRRPEARVLSCCCITDHLPQATNGLVCKVIPVLYPRRVCGVRGMGPDGVRACSMALCIVLGEVEDARQ